MNLLFDVTVKTSVILLCGLVATLLLRRRSAALRHWVLSMALFCAAAAPILKLALPAWQFPDALRARDSVQAGVAGPAQSVSAADGSGSARREPVSGAEEFPIATAFTTAWTLGVLISLSSLIAGLRRLAGIAARATRIEGGAWVDRMKEVSREQGLRRPLTLLETKEPLPLVTWGFRRPKVIVPFTARTWHEERMSLVLHHEVAHVRRGDWVVQIAAELMRAVYWFNPLVWITAARLRQESEWACDDVVMNHGVGASAYATHLVEIARALQSRQSWLPAPAMARPSSLERRVRAMLDSQLDRRPPSRRMCAASLAVMFAITTAVAGFAAAQGFASLAGSIVDPTNAVLPDVTLVLTNERNGAKYELRSDRTGRYEFVGLPPGDYGLEARIPGFAAFQGKVTLTGQNVEQNLTLQVGSLQETVTVVASDDDVPSPVDSERERLLEERLQKRAAAKCPGTLNSASVQIGGNIRTPMKLRDARPHYPASLRGTGTEGAVMLKGRIDTNGNIDELDVVSSAHPDLATAAVDAVKQWQFDPTLLNCVPIPVAITVTVNFHVRR